MKTKKNNKYKKSILFVNKIQKIRSKNNKNWMDLLKLALKLDHKKASKILAQIHEHDIKISKLVSKIKNS
tara:strand:+ start:809 stop:1018 length:210 start_codon:yes stop_codon:yes gene_type:complete